jgi:uroporphyrinogen decarboxylase
MGMDNRERMQLIISGQAADRCAFWLGNPHPDTWPIYHAFFGTTTDEELRLRLQDDFRWVMANDYHEPGGPGAFSFERASLSAPGPLAGCRDPEEIETAFHWPDPDFLDLEPALQALRAAGGYYRASGTWSCFYHNVMDLFGMEQYMVNMMTNAPLVRAVTDRVCRFYYECNERLYERAGNLIDGFFFGNDFGTQRDLICGPQQFDEFIAPWFRRFTAQAHAHGYQVLLHSCGSIFKVIDRLIDMGVECLHPLQARAANMDAETLARYFKGRIAFMGGIDTQELLIHATPDEVKAEVRRVKELLGPCLIVSPSHEALLPNVPPENVAAMAEAARE